MKSDDTVREPVEPRSPQDRAAAGTSGIDHRRPGETLAQRPFRTAATTRSEDEALVLEAEQNLANGVVTGTVGDAATVAPQNCDLDVLGEWHEGLLIADRYRILSFIGKGGMGKVYLAQDEMLDRPIALKRVPEEIIFDADARDDLRQEANRLLDLAHDNIVRIHTYYDGPTWPFIAMEYLHGPTLKQLLRARKQYGRSFELDEVLSVVRHVARGLSYAHSKNIVHRDLKPGNLMLAETVGDRIADSDTVKITDFGISRVIADGTLRQTGKPSGTLPYMSPEQFRGEVSTAKSDIYSLACTLYELLSGRPPFYTGDIGYQIIHVEARPLADTPKSIGNAILRGLAKDPDERYDSVDEFVEALDGKVVVRPPRRVRNEQLRRPLKFLAACFVLGLIFVAGREWQRLQTTGSLSEPQSSTNLGASAAGRTLTQAGSDAQRNRITSPPTRRGFPGFAAWVRGRLRESLPETVGRSDTVQADSGNEDEVSFDLALPRPVDQNFARRLFDEMAIRYHSDAPLEWTPRVASVVDTVVGRRFTLNGLTDGTHLVEIIVPGLNGEKTSLFGDEQISFRVDLTAPIIKLQVVEKGLLIDRYRPTSIAPPQWGEEDGVNFAEIPATFAESIDVELKSSEDVARAEYRIEGGGSRAWLPIADPKRWSLDLVEGKNEFQIAAYDAHGNRREIVKIFRRLQLKVKAFGLDGAITGDVVQVIGELRYEGTHVPALKYLMNGLDVAPETSSLEHSGDESVDANVRSVRFGATLRLPRPFGNSIELRYALVEGMLQPFPNPVAVRVSGLSIQAPEINFKPTPSRTRNESARLSGTVKPYFRGLELSVENSVQSTEALELDFSLGDGIATFSHHIRLLENQPHSFQVRCFYMGEELAPAPAPIRVYCDQRPPSLTQSIEFVVINKTSLWMVIRPSEDLKALRIQRAPIGRDPGPWEEKSPAFRSPIYRLQVNTPGVPTEFRVEMVDLAGNLGTARAICPYPALRGADFDGELNSAVARPAVAKEGASRTTGVNYRSSFLQEMSMEFRPFGFERDEMGTTEVTEKVWAAFLQRTVREAAPPENPSFPKILAEDEARLLEEFVKWFEESANDGFSYDLPTGVQWLRAFTGATDAAMARAQITAWFEGERLDGKRFHAFVEPRYDDSALRAVGSRSTNRTPTGLFDMEASVEEIIRDGSAYRVIGGYNGLVMIDDFARACRQAREWKSRDTSMTGFRLVRKPRGAKSE